MSSPGKEVSLYVCSCKSPSLISNTTTLTTLTGSHPLDLGFNTRPKTLSSPIWLLWHILWWTKTETISLFPVDFIVILLFFSYLVSYSLTQESTSSDHPFIHPSKHCPSIHSTVHPTIHPSAYLSICLSVHLPIRQSIHPSIRLSVTSRHDSWAIFVSSPVQPSPTVRRCIQPCWFSC